MGDEFLDKLRRKVIAEGAAHLAAFPLGAHEIGQRACSVDKRQRQGRVDRIDEQAIGAVGKKTARNHCGNCDDADARSCDRT